MRLIKYKFHNLLKGFFKKVIAGTTNPMASLYGATISDDDMKKIQVKGQMVLLHDKEYMIYICGPYVATLQQMIAKHMHLSDIPLHSATRDLIMLNQSRMSELEMEVKLTSASDALKTLSADVAKEKELTENVVAELLPASIIESLKSGKPNEPEQFDSCSIVFTDIVKFTVLCAKSTPMQVVNMLNQLYVRFDRLSALNHLFKMETIGDAYMAVAGVPHRTGNHASMCLNMAIGMQMECRQVKHPIDGVPIRIRAGVHTGPVLAGVVGVKMPRYCLFGSTPEIAQRMESGGVPSKIHLSESCYNSCEETTPDNYTFESRGQHEIKGVGNVVSYFLISNRQKSVWELIDCEKPDGASIDGYKELHDFSCYAEDI